MTSSIVAPLQGTNHFWRCDGGFLSPAGFVTRRYHNVAPLRGVQRLRRLTPAQYGGDAFVHGHGPCTQDERPARFGGDAECEK